jgi:outer membrane protein assembly factor BamB
VDSFSITLAGRWRANATSGPSPERRARRAPLRDHIELRLGDRHLTAHLGEDDIIPFLTALAEALAPKAPDGPADCPLHPSNCRLSVERLGALVRLSLVAAGGRVIVHQEPVAAATLTSAVRTAATRLLTELDALDAGWARQAPIRRLRRAIRLLEDTSNVPLPPASPGAIGRSAGRVRRAPASPSRFPLTVGERGLRLGVQWATGDGMGSRPVVFLRLLDAVLTLARTPERRQAIPWSTTPRTVLAFERRPDGLVSWSLRDTVAPWMTGTIGMSTLLAILARCGRQVPAINPPDLAARLREIRAWLRASALETRYGEPILTVDDRPPTLTARPEALPGEPPARRLFHVALRRAWRRPLRRFLLPPQSIGGPAILVHLPDASIGMASTTGHEAWRRPSTYPALLGGPCGLVFDGRNRLGQLDLSTGATVWCQRRSWTAGPVAAAAADRDGLVLVSEAGEVVGLDARGERHFRTRLAAGTALGLAISRTLVWLLGEDRHLYGLRRSDGGVHFRVPVPGHPIGAPVWRTEGLLVASDEGPRTRLSVHDPETGAERFALGVSGAFQSLRAIAETGRSPPRVAVVSVVDEMTAFTVADLRAGAVAFSLPSLPGRATLTTARGALLCGGAGGHLAAFDADDGEGLWQVAGDDPADSTAPPVQSLAVGGLVYALGTALSLIDPADGRVVSRYPLDEFDVASWLVSPRGDVLLADTDRALLLLERSGHLARVG